jgi:hypothetical protein
MNHPELRAPELRDIQLPDASLWWPPAPGWWISLGLILLLVWLLPRLLRWLKHKPLRRLSQQELARIRLNYQQGHSDRAVLGEVAALLRRVTMSYYGREQYASATGSQWLEQLQTLAPGAGLSVEQLELLAHQRYRAQCEFDVEALLQSTETWLRALPRSRDNVPA